MAPGQQKSARAPVVQDFWVTTPSDHYHYLTHQLWKTSCPIASELKDTHPFSLWENFLLDINPVMDVIFYWSILIFFKTEQKTTRA